ncbi:MAG: 5-(carboxyamino)imidazole ribonucleotide mutase [Chitinophagia bacterium]|nr:5-(carboxyamino)imidazole ribonucleotide mutase [Chitinophagia bacterium]
MNGKVAIVMGSISDFEVMRPAGQVLASLGIPFEFAIISAHRAPRKMFAFATSLEEHNISIVIAGAGGAAHLPGMVAALTTVPVIGVPVKSAKSIAGVDSLLSIVQMPDDVPVATMAINNAHNAGILAAQMLAITNPAIKAQLQHLKESNQNKVDNQNNQLKQSNDHGI